MYFWRIGGPYISSFSISSYEASSNSISRELLQAYGAGGTRTTANGTHADHLRFGRRRKNVLKKWNHLRPMTAAAAGKTNQKQNITMYNVITIIVYIINDYNI